MPDLLDPPPNSNHAAEAALTVAKVGLNLVPIVGGSAAELVESVVGPMLVRRRERWFEEVADAIRILQRQHVPVDSEEFVTAVAHASRIALGTHLDEKLTMLKAAIIHSALPDRPTDVMTMRFLRFVDELDPEHFAVLAYLRHPGGHWDRHGMQRMALGHKGGALARSPQGVLTEFAGLPVNREDIEVILADLVERKLLDPNRLESPFVAEEWSAVTTPRGDQLLDFVTYVEPPGERVEPVGREQ